MRFPDREGLTLRADQQLLALTRSRAQDSIDHRPNFRPRQLYGFVDGGMLWRSKSEKLVKTEPQDVLDLRFNSRRPKASDPKIEQRQVADHSVEQFKRKAAIRRRERRVGQEM
jgi:hypothetical protein